MVTMERIIVGYDNSPAARGALRWAVHHASRTGAELIVVYVVSSAFEWELNAVQINTDTIRKDVEHRLRGEWTEIVRDAGVRYEIELKLGRPAEALLAAARRNEAVLIVIGMTPRGTLGELVFSSVGHHLSHHAVRPIVTVPAGWEPESNSDAPPHASASIGRGSDCDDGISASNDQRIHPMSTRGLVSVQRVRSR
jgi:nucleotide-binding universal stress UspA family protein